MMRHGYLCYFKILKGNQLTTVTKIMFEQLRKERSAGSYLQWARNIHIFNRFILCRLTNTRFNSDIQIAFTKLTPLE